VTRRDSGALSHTNHYCTIDSQDIKQKPGLSSRTRLARIDELLKTHPQPYSIEHFIRFSADQNAGSDNSIWRTGSGRSKRRTVAAWIVAIPPAGSPQLYLKTVDPGEPEQVCRLSLAEAFRLKGGDRIPLAAALCNGPVH
jgi:isopenicillin-N N-acyltransferase like protein